MTTPSFLDKIVARDQAPVAVRALATSGPVVFTNGVFDVLHRGHVTYLAQARAEGAALWSHSTPTRQRVAWAKVRTVRSTTKWTAPS